MSDNIEGEQKKNRNELAKLFDHTYLKAYASYEDMKRLCDEAKSIGCAMVAINSSMTRICKELLKGTDIHVGTAISFPLGQTTLETKLFETKDAIDNGADEIDYVVNLTAVKNGDYAYVEKEMTEISKLCHDNNVICKVIFENCYLTKDEIAKLSEIALKVLPDYIKTSTGFGSAITMLDAIKNMQKFTGCSINDIVRMSSYNPSIIAKVNDTKGSIEKGKDADHIILDKDLNLKMTMVNGEVLFIK